MKAIILAAGLLIGVPAVYGQQSSQASAPVTTSLPAPDFTNLDTQTWDADSAAFQRVKGKMRAYLGIELFGNSGDAATQNTNVKLRYQWDGSKLRIAIISPDPMADMYTVFKPRFTGWVVDGLGGK